MNESFANVHAIVREAVAAHATPGAQLSVRWRAGDTWQAHDAAFGTLDYSPGSTAITTDTRYDLASVTKAIVALAAVRLAARGAIALDARLGDVLDEARHQDAHDVTIESLLAHRSELPAWYPFYRAIEAREAERGGTHARIVADVARMVREPNGGKARYSDVGYILLGEAIARATGRPLDEIVREEVTTPLGIDGVIRYRGVAERFRSSEFAPTEWCEWRGRVVQGTVHDENAYALEGLAGHAGLFGTARALAEVGRASLDSLRGESPWFDRAWMERMIAPREGGSHRLGWDGKSAQGSSAGTRMSTRTFGHLGFTGTSLWCDPDANVVVALVTNRVHPSRENNAIRALRIAVHDAVMM